MRRELRVGKDRDVDAHALECAGEWPPQHLRADECDRFLVGDGSDAGHHVALEFLHPLAVEDEVELAVEIAQRLVETGFEVRFEGEGHELAEWRDPPDDG